MGMVVHQKGDMKGVSSHAYCDYITVMRHSRPCWPGECRQTGVFRSRKGGRKEEEDAAVPEEVLEEIDEEYEMDPA